MRIGTIELDHAADELGREGGVEYGGLAGEDPSAQGLAEVEDEDIDIAVEVEVCGDGVGALAAGVLGLVEDLEGRDAGGEVGRSGDTGVADEAQVAVGAPSDEEVMPVEAVEVRNGQAHGVDRAEREGRFGGPGGTEDGQPGGAGGIGGEGDERAVDDREVEDGCAELEGVEALSRGVQEGEGGAAGDGEDRLACALEGGQVGGCEGQCEGRFGGEVAGGVCAGATEGLTVERERGKVELSGAVEVAHGEGATVGEGATEHQGRDIAGSAGRGEGLVAQASQAVRGGDEDVVTIGGRIGREARGAEARDAEGRLGAGWREDDDGHTAEVGEHVRAEVAVDVAELGASKGAGVAQGLGHADEARLVERCGVQGRYGGEEEQRRCAGNRGSTMGRSEGVCSTAAQRQGFRARRRRTGAGPCRSSPGSPTTVVSGPWA